jgi:hypothetical protein
MNLEVNELANYHVAKTVSDLRQHSSPELAALAKRIRNDWKQSFTASASTDAAPTTSRESIEVKTSSSNKAMDANIISNLSALINKKAAAVAATTAASSADTASTAAVGSTGMSDTAPTTLPPTHRQNMQATLSKVSSLLKPLQSSSSSSLGISSTDSAVHQQRQPVEPIIFPELGKYTSATDGIQAVYVGQNRGIVRLHCIRLLLSTSLPQFDIARYIEERAFNLLVKKTSKVNDARPDNQSPPVDPSFNEYSLAIIRIAFSLKEV